MANAMNNIRHRFRVFGHRNSSSNTTTTSSPPSVRTPSNGSSLVLPNESSHPPTSDSSHRTRATREVTPPSTNTRSTSNRRQVRQLGCHKGCCGGFCLRLGRDTCCLHACHAPHVREEHRYCSFCCDRRREERVALRQLERRRLSSFSDTMSTVTSSSAAAASSTTPIAKACCGKVCTGPSYTHCCEHNGVRRPLNLESYCLHCRERCLQEDCDDDNSVDAVRLTPTPPGRHQLSPVIEEPPQITTSNKDLERCISKCLSSIECPVCLETYGADPCTLPCGHSMCLTHVPNVNRCPICRWPITADWKKYAQPSLALRESAMAVREAVTLLVQMESKFGTENKEDESSSKSKPSSAKSIQWAPPEGVPKQLRISSDTSSCTSSTESDSEDPPCMKPAGGSVIGKSADC